jgi:hypothetical protein
MGITLAISWQTILQPTDWSVGYCVRCDRFEAIQVGDLVEVTTAYEITMSRRVIGRGARCDWCGTGANPMPEAQVIPRGRWSYAEGVRALFEKCAPALLAHAPQLTADDDLRPLLSWVQRRSSVDSVDIGVGVIEGALVGAVLGVGVALYVLAQGGYDAIRTVMLWLPLGGVAGMVVGATAEAVLKGRKVAREMIAAAYLKYRLNPVRLTDLSHSYRARVRSAVRGVVAAPPLPSPKEPT